MPCCWGYCSCKLDLYQLVFKSWNLKFSMLSLKILLIKEETITALSLSTLTGILFWCEHFFESKSFLLSPYLLCIHFREKVLLNFFFGSCNTWMEAILLYCSKYSIFFIACVTCNTLSFLKKSCFDSVAEKSIKGFRNFCIICHNLTFF